MIIKKDFEINVEKLEFNKLSNIEHKEDSIFDSVNKVVHVRQKKVTGEDWRLIYDDKKVISLFKGQGVTYTLEKVEEFKTEEEALTQIDNLNLTFDTESPAITFQK